MSVWEKCDMFKVVIDINEYFLKMPREGDTWIMQLFVRAGFNKEITALSEIGRESRYSK